MKALALCVALAAFSPQEDGEEPAYTVRVTPASLELEVGDTGTIEAKLFDADGQAVGGDDIRIMYFTRSRGAVKVKRDGSVTAVKPGTWEVVARAATRERPRPVATVTVNVKHPPLERIEFVDPPDRIYAGTTQRVRARLVDVKGTERGDVAIEVATGGSGSATVDALGHVTGTAPGICELVAEAEGFRASHQLEIASNPVSSLALRASATEVRTGDVVTFEAAGVDANGNPQPDVPVHFSFEARPDDTLGQAATGQIEQDGRFVAEAPGVYTIVATCGDAVAKVSIRADARNVQRKIELVGQGKVLDVHTSDLWVWEGVDGRDYCVTGTWGANGEAYFWDVTDPTAIERIATVTVDARTVNDVKVSEDGRLCVISREGASNRKNGIVIIDVENPADPEIISTFTENLTGGVHNLFIYQDHVYALSAARRYDIINIEDPAKPHRVGSFELEEPGHSIHDVWVENGIAYSSNWSNGVHIVDVGGGGMGGSPSNPVPMGDYQYPSGWNHAAFPYRSSDTGKFYVIAGDEAFPYNLYTENKPTYPRGWFHFVDFSDMENPKEVARYEVPEAGTHNLWVEDDVLYAAYYNGGLRVVDISGDLMGDLYKQGREIGWFLPTDHKGKIPNAPMVWGPQPHKGNIFFSDWNSGLWAVKVVPETQQ